MTSSSSDLLLGAMRAKGIHPGDDAAEYAVAQVLAAGLARTLAPGKVGPSRQACTLWLRGGQVGAEWHPAIGAALPDLDLDAFAGALGRQAAERAGTLPVTT